MSRSLAVALLLLGALHAGAQCVGSERPTIFIFDATLRLGGDVDLNVGTLSGTLSATGDRIVLSDPRSFRLSLTEARVTLNDTTVRKLVETALEPTGLQKIRFATKNGKIDETARWLIFTITLGGSVELNSGMLRLSDKPSWYLRLFAPAVLNRSRDHSIRMAEDGRVIIDPIKLLAPYLAFTGDVTKLQIGTGEMTETFGLPPAPRGSHLVTVSGANIGRMLGLNIDASEVTISSASGRLGLRMKDIASQLSEGTISQEGCATHITMP